VAYIPSLFWTDGDDAETREVGQLLGGWMATQVVRTVSELGIPDHLAVGPRTAAELAESTGSVAEPMERLLTFAAVFGLVVRDDGRYKLTKTGERLRTDVPGSLRPVALGIVGPPQWEAMGRLGELVRTGQTADGSAPGGPWEYFQDHPEAARWFALAMRRGIDGMVRQMRAAGYGLPDGVRRVVDVGGSHGTLLAHLLTTAPQAAGVLFDRAEALSEAPPVLSAAGVADRVEMVTGDFFVSVPEGDVHLLSQILHDWDDKSGQTILRRCHEASETGGLLLVFTFVLTEEAGPPHPYLMDLMMMAVEGGKVRTLPQMRSLLASGGYDFIRDVPLPGPMPWHILEFRRA
jgi:hypothetical protein